MSVLADNKLATSVAVAAKEIKPDEAKIANAVVTESLDVAEPKPIVCDDDAMDVDGGAAAETAAEDELARELEEIEGPKHVEDGKGSASCTVDGGAALLSDSLATITNAKATSAADNEQKTADLLKDLESDVPSSVAAAAASEQPPPTKADEKSNEVVDSTTETSLKRKIASISGSDVAASMAAAAKKASDGGKADGETVVTATATAVEPLASSSSSSNAILVDSGKEEAITSTSSDAAAASVKEQSNVDAPTTTTKTTVVTATGEADSSKSPVAKVKHAAEQIPSDVSATADKSKAEKMDVDDTDLAASSSSAVKTVQNKVENKPLTNMMNNGSSTPKSYPASPDISGAAAASGGGVNVFNSTPIQKQFEVKSENVSKIDEHSACGEKGGTTTDVTTDASSDFPKSGQFGLRASS